MEPIVSERLELRPLSAELIDAVLADRAAEVGLDTPADWPDAHDRGFLALRGRELTEHPELLGWFVYAVIADGVMVGHAGFHGPRGRNSLKDPDAVEIGYTIFPPFRRRGYATEAVQALITWAREKHGIRRFLFSIAPDNEPSLAIARRLGLSEIGRHWDEEDGEELEFEGRFD